ncbi:acyltransferase [Dietzia kunjamensis]|uniref:acyltransferase family protein n=1 Tax=Dietzia kunjamensis TaxID=322509 RepID=UPI002DB5F797|nr:acyltransferase [Dietzia kunjamensis]MEB8325974.1 acyltransferase [Dietzia kunjamensis]
MGVKTAGPQESTLKRYHEAFYRPDIQGIRAISALLIMIYHIWLNRVSGGVDVFFVVSGFLMTTILLRGAAASGKVSLIAFWKRIVLRVFPSAYLVLVATLVLSLLFVPPPAVEVRTQ